MEIRESPIYTPANRMQRHASGTRPISGLERQAGALVVGVQALPTFGRPSTWSSSEVRRWKRGLSGKPSWTSERAEHRVNLRMSRICPSDGHTATGVGHWGEP
jgi:hypothetical protein